MNIIFKTITIENFKGVRDKRVITFSTRRTMLVGDNHTGKTTTADAANWVLFGKDSHGKSDFGITPTDENNEPIHHLESTVTIDITADGIEYSLQKVRKEKWVRVKQQTEETLQGYTTLYFVNGEKYTEKDYKVFINGLISENLFRAITNPEYFPSLKPEEQRQLLIKMVGVKSDEEIAAENPEFAAMLKSIEGQDIKEYRQQLSYKMKELKKAMEDIPGRISERKAEINSLRDDECDYKAAEERIADIDKEIQDNQSRMQDCSLVLNKRFEEKANIRKEIDDLRNKERDIERRYEDANAEANRNTQSAIRNAESKVNAIKSRIQSEEYSMKMHERSVEDMERRKANFRKEWQECEAMEFVWDTTNETCPTCGQRLPHENIEKLENDARNRFNVEKVNKQDNLDRIAKELKAESERIDAMKTSTAKKIAELKAELADAEVELKKVQETTANPILADYRNDADLQKLKNDICAKHEELQELDDQKDTGADDTIKQLTEANNALSRERNGLVYKFTQKEQIEKCEQRIQELTEQQRTLNQQLADLEKQYFTAEQFQFAVIQDLQDRVNKLFPTIRFKMFNKLLNGNVDPTCVLTMHGVSYHNLSTSEKIIAGLECIEA
ncbi:AAA family ATPase, partial [bacterium]|nr:AAA family ATPase [bacterium]